MQNEYALITQDVKKVCPEGRYGQTHQQFDAVEH